MQEIMTLINNRLKTDFERNLFSASLKAIEDKDSPIRYNSFASSFRELTRHVLSRLAPDNKVRACQWYVNETDKPNGITRKQRMLYSIKGGLNDQFIRDKLNFNFDAVLVEMRKVVENLNKYTHIEENTFNVNSKLVEDMVLKALSALNEFLESAEMFSKELIDAYEILLSELIDQALISDTLDKIDILATHYQIEGSWIEAISINSIDESEILVAISGNVEVEHQYGSDRDYIRGDGLRFSESYPFKISLQIHIETPLSIDIEVDDIEIDTSKHFD